MRLPISSVVVVPLALLLAGCGGDRLASPPATAGLVPGVAAASPESPPGLISERAGWAYAVGARTRARATIGGAADRRPVTRVLVEDAATGATRRVRRIGGPWALPVPVARGATEGLSWDGALVVMRSANVPSRFVAFPVASGGRPQIVDLRARGRFDFDALSPDGRRLYLTQYSDRRGRSVSRVRVYDLATGTLDPLAVVIKGEDSNAMEGSPVARVWSPDGAIAYTLYEGSEHPFVHMLLTNAATSFCIDLPARPDPSATGGWSLRLDATSRTLTADSERLNRSFLIGLRDTPGDVPTVERVTALSGEPTAP